MSNFDPWNDDLDDYLQAAEDAAQQAAIDAAEEAAYDAEMERLNEVARQAAYEAEQERLEEERYWKRRYDELAERYASERYG